MRCNDTTLLAMVFKATSSGKTFWSGH